jgi:ABC-2 type transport system permease protein
VKAKRSFSSPSQIVIALGLAKYALKASFRNKASYFFSLIFPLIFVVIFGLLGNSGASIKLGVSDTIDKTNPIYQTIKNLSEQENAPIELIEGSEPDLEKQLSQAKIASIIAPDQSVRPMAGSLTLVSSNSNPQGKAAAESFLSGVISQMNIKASGIVRQPFAFNAKEISGKEYRYIDYALPGQIGFSLLSIATFGIAFPLITLRKTLVLKRMFATTVKPITFVVAQCLSRSFQAMLQAAVLLTVGVLAFHFTLAHGWITFVQMIFLSFLAVLAFLGFGLFIGNVARDEQSLPIALNLFNLPQILLAGVFFPIDGMPKWLQFIGNNLPLAYFNTALRKISVEGIAFVDIWPYILGMIVWGFVAYIAAARVFKTE